MPSKLFRRLRLISVFLAAALPATPQAASQTESKAQAEPTREPLAEALEKLGQDDLEGAIAILEPLREAGSASPQALATLGALYAEIGLASDALEVLGPLAEGPDANPAVLYNAGRAAIAAGEEEAGEEYLARSVRTHSVSPAARLLGLRLGGRGQTAAAYRLLRPWALANPEDEEARLAAAVAALRLERVPEAAELLDGLANTNPRTRLLRADLSLQRRDPTTALELLAPLANDHPPEMNLDVLTLLATAYIELGRSAEAVALLEQRGGEHPKLALLLAQAQYQGGDVAAALASLHPFAEPVLAADQVADAPAPQRQLAGAIVLEHGRLLLASDRAAEAAVALERATELQPWSRDAWQELARAHAAAGEPEQARAAAERLRAIAEARERAAVPGLAGRQRLEDPTARRLAQALEWSERGEPEKALDVVRQEISLSPEDLRPRLFEIRTLLRLGRNEEARGSLEAALERFPDHPDMLQLRTVVDDVRARQRPEDREEPSGRLQ